jgi:hypothetical protein
MMGWRREWLVVARGRAQPQHERSALVRTAAVAQVQFRLERSPIEVAAMRARWWAQPQLACAIVAD